jgi:uncharacterized protein YkwD
MPTPSPLPLRFCAMILAGALLTTSGCASVLSRADDMISGYHKVSSAGPIKMTQQEYDVVKATNAYREAHGLSDLKPDDRLNVLARMRSSDMATHGYFSHVSPTGNDVFSLMHLERIAFWAAGENLARNNYKLKVTGKIAMEGWIKSPGHRANLLQAAYGHMGVGVVTAKNGMTYLTQVFTD